MDNRWTKVIYHNHLFEGPHILCLTLLTCCALSMTWGEVKTICVKGFIYMYWESLYKQAMHCPWPDKPQFGCYAFLKSKGANSLHTCFKLSDMSLFSCAHNINWNTHLSGLGQIISIETQWVKHNLQFNLHI